MAFRKRTYSVAALLRDAVAVAARPRELADVFVLGKGVTPALREAIMVAVAAENACRYCLYVHSEWANREGLSEEAVDALVNDTRGVPAELQPAIAYARAYHANGMQPVGELRERTHAVYGERAVAGIETTVRAMHLANLTGNTFDALFARLQGEETGGKLGDELLVAAVFGTAAVPISLVLSVAWRRSPLRMAREVFGRR